MYKSQLEIKGGDKTMNNKYIVARWDGLDSYRSYLKSYPDGIVSQDGDEWHDSAGHLCKGAEFDAVRIKLIGGPRHGTMVG